MRFASKMVHEVKRIGNLQLEIQLNSEIGLNIPYNEISQKFLNIDSTDESQELNLVHLKILLEGITGKSLQSILRASLAASLTSNPESETAESEGSLDSTETSESVSSSSSNHDALPPPHPSDEILVRPLSRVHSSSFSPNNAEIVFGVSSTGGRMVEKGTLKGFLSYMCSSIIGM